jgi:hypothetical protein
MFWEELIAYFLLIRPNRKKRRLQQFFFAAGTFLQCCYLATIGAYTDRPTDFPLVRHGPHKNDVSNNSFFVARIRCRGNVLTGPLPTTDRETPRLMGGIYEVRRWAGLRYHHTVTILSDYRRSFGLEIGFIDHLQVVTTSDYEHNTIASFHTLQITAAQAKSFQSAFISRFLVTDFKNGDSTTAPTKSSLHRLPYNWLWTD